MQYIQVYRPKIHVALPRQLSLDPGGSVIKTPDLGVSRRGASSHGCVVSIAGLAREIVFEIRVFAVMPTPGARVPPCNRSSTVELLLKELATTVAAAILERQNAPEGGLQPKISLDAAAAAVA